MGYLEKLDDETTPRNAAAIRTALLMGAEFVQIADGTVPCAHWEIKGTSVGAHSKAMTAWLYLVTFGICIDKQGRAIKCGEMPQDEGCFESYRRIGNINSL